MSRTQHHAQVGTKTGTRHRLARAAGAALIAAAAVTGIASPAFAHDELVGTQVVTDTAGAPEAVRLSFSNSIVEVGTEIVVRSASGDDATDGAPEVDGPDVTQPLAADLEPGNYSAAWRVVSSDGHPIEGSFALVIAEDGGATIADAAIAEPDPRFADESSVADEGEHAHADGAEGSAAGEQDAEGAPVGALIAVIVGGAAVIAGGLAAASVGRRRRAQGMAADAARNGTGADARPSAAQDEEDRA